MTTVSGTFTAVGASSLLTLPAVGEVVEINLSGTYVATVELQRRRGSVVGGTWSALPGFKWSGNPAVVPSYVTTRKGEVLRLWCSAYTSGTVTFSFNDGVKILHEFKDARGNVLFQIDQDGFIFRPANGAPILTKVAAPTTSTTETDMTEAQLLGGIHSKTPTAAQNFQVPTATEILAAIRSGIAAGDSFEFTLINIGGAGDDVTLTVDTGVTFVGDAVCRPLADADTDGTGSATFRFRCVALDTPTFVGYRVS